MALIADAKRVCDNLVSLSHTIFDITRFILTLGILACQSQSIGRPATASCTLLPDRYRLREHAPASRTRVCATRIHFQRFRVGDKQPAVLRHATQRTRRSVPASAVLSASRIPCARSRLSLPHCAVLSISSRCLSLLSCGTTAPAAECSHEHSSGSPSSFHQQYGDAGAGVCSVHKYTHGASGTAWQFIYI